MLVLGARIDLELLEHGAAQAVLRQHAAHGRKNGALGRFLHDPLQRNGLEVSDVAGVAVIHLLVQLVAGHTHL